MVSLSFKWCNRTWGSTSSGSSIQWLENRVRLAITYIMFQTANCFFGFLPMGKQKNLLIYIRKFLDAGKSKLTQ